MARFNNSGFSVSRCAVKSSTCWIFKLGWSFRCPRIISSYSTFEVDNGICNSRVNQLLDGSCFRDLEIESVRGMYGSLVSALRILYLMIVGGCIRCNQIFISLIVLGRLFPEFLCPLSNIIWSVGIVVSFLVFFGFVR